MNKLGVMDLYSGIGGMSLGLERTGGFKTVVFCEIDNFCQQVLHQRWPDVPVYPDVRTLDYDGPVDVITSGDPCQKDSRANASRDGASMWRYTHVQIRRHKPSYAIRENVEGNIDTRTLLQVETDLRNEGYTVRTYSLEAMAFGAPHCRPRTWTLAHTDSPGRQKLHHAPKSGKTEGWQHSMLAGENGLYWVGSEPLVLRKSDDVPHRVDRIGRLGNAVVPVIPQLIGEAILAVEAAA